MHMYVQWSMFKIECKIINKVIMWCKEHFRFLKHIKLFNFLLFGYFTIFITQLFRKIEYEIWWFWCLNFFFLKSCIPLLFSYLVSERIKGSIWFNFHVVLCHTFGISFFYFFLFLLWEIIIVKGLKIFSWVLVRVYNLTS